MSGEELHDGRFSMTVKLPVSGEIAKATMANVDAAGYGLGKSG